MNINIPDDVARNMMKGYEGKALIFAMTKSGVITIPRGEFKTVYDALRLIKALTSYAERLTEGVIKGLNKPK